MKPQSKHTLRCTALVAVLAIAALAGCGRDGAMNGGTPFGPNTSGNIAATSDPNTARIVLPFDPVNFGTNVANSYFPLTPGTRYSYVAQTSDGVETNEVEITHDTKVILGVTATVIHDRVFLDGSLIEDTFDWYAGDSQGNVWYLGEDTKTYEDGVLVSTAGSWEAGAGGAQPGIFMLASPNVGDQYAQENAPGVVEDQGKVLSLKETVTVPYGTFTNCLKTADWTPIEPGNREFKYYAPGIGLVLEVARRGGGERVELTGYSTP